jgi:hypothetical protein
MLEEMLASSFTKQLTSTLLLIDWSKFEIYFTIIFLLLFSGIAVYKLFGLEKRESIGYIIAFLVCLGSSIIISIFWIHNLPVLLRSIGWLLVILIGLPSVIAVCFGAITSPRSKEKESRRMSAILISGGLIGFFLCILISRFMIRFPWLNNLNWTNPYLYGIVMATLISSILGLLINILKEAFEKTQFDQSFCRMAIRGK